MAALFKRRALLVLGVGLALTGCAAAVTDNPAIPVISRIEVTGSGNLWLRTMPPYLQARLKSQLGSRYQPGAREGATLQVRLTDVDFPTDSDAGPGAFSFDSVDSMNGKITLATSSGGVIKSFPLFATTSSVDAASEIPMPTPRRYDWLASSYAHWLLSKLT